MPVAGVALACGQFAVALDPRKPTGPERAADVGVATCLELDRPQRADCDRRWYREVDHERIRPAVADCHLGPLSELPSDVILDTLVFGVFEDFLRVVELDEFTAGEKHCRLI